MSFVKPSNITYQQIADNSGISLRTIKRYAAGGNPTQKTVDAINRSLSIINSHNKIKADGIIPVSQQEFFFPKTMFKQHLFWSSPVDRTRNIDGVIEAYVKTPNIYDIHILVRLFGAARVLKIAKDVYIEILAEFSIHPRKILTLPEYKNVVRMVNYSMNLSQRVIK